MYVPAEVETSLERTPPEDSSEGFVFAMLRVKIDGSFAELVQVIVKGSVESMIAPAAGDVNVMAAAALKKM